MKDYMTTLVYPTKTKQLTKNGQEPYAPLEAIIGDTMKEKLKEIQRMWMLSHTEIKFTIKSLI